MGELKQDVFEAHLRYFRQEHDLISVFLKGFDVTWGRRRRGFGSEFSLYLINPEKYIRDTFGFDSEVAVFIFNYAHSQPRQIQAINQAFMEEPLAGRADPGLYFLISGDPNIKQWTEDYCSRNPQTRHGIPVTTTELISSRNDEWYIRNLIRRAIFIRDLFDYRLPIMDDLYFFGRDGIVADLVDSIKKVQNRGLFGLRKTGKTSILFKVKRQCETSNIAKIAYVDCKAKFIRDMTAPQLIRYLSTSICQLFDIRVESVRQADDFTTFHRVCQTVNNQRSRLCIIFDEIEYLSPLSKLNEHWQSDFIDLWQTLWSEQSSLRSFNFIVCGVNPLLTEMPNINNVQNPLFGIISPLYLRGLEKDAISRMLRFFGRRMGLLFEVASVESLFSDYGGHPLLTRLACSHIHIRELEADSTRPIKISALYIEGLKESADEFLAPYCKHIVSELELFYPDEYEMLRLASVGLTGDFIELSREPTYVAHLKSYGVMEISPDRRPEIRFPILKRFLANDYSRSHGIGRPREISPPDAREFWISRRIEMILADFRRLLKLVEKLGARKIYPATSVPDADRLFPILICNTEADFRSFISLLNQVLVENIDKYNPPGYFFGQLKQEFPDLFEAMHRIRSYRNWMNHEALNQITDQAVRTFLHNDLFGNDVRSISEGWFLLQQICLDEVFSSLQWEITRIET
jgi:hypothetical protein